MLTVDIKNVSLKYDASEYNIVISSILIIWIGSVWYVNKESVSF